MVSSFMTRFVILKCNICSPFKEEKIYEYIFVKMFKTLLIVLVSEFSDSNLYYF